MEDLELPTHLFSCPICGSPLILGAVTAEELNEELGRWEPSEIEVDCATQPDLGDTEFEAWWDEHYRTPYIDWLPLTERVLHWLKAPQ